MLDLLCVSFEIESIIYLGSCLLTNSHVHAGGCVLDFKSYQHQQISGNCSGVSDKINDWRNNFPNTLCCRNALTILPQAFAQYVNNTKGSILTAKDLWKDCGASFQQYMAPMDCGFDDLFNGNSQCSNFSLAATIKGEMTHQSALERCSHFEYAFDDACTNCTGAILDVREYLLDQYSQGVMDDNTERAKCGVTAIIYVAAGNWDNGSFVDEFYRCLPGLHEEESGKNYSHKLCLFVG